MLALGIWKKNAGAAVHLIRELGDLKAQQVIFGNKLEDILRSLGTDMMALTAVHGSSIDGALSSERIDQAIAGGSRASAASAPILRAYNPRLDPRVNPFA